MRASRSNLEQEVAALGDLGRDELEALWTRVHGTPPPKGARRDLLVRSAAWHLQAKRLGGLYAETRRLLRSAVSSVENEKLVRGTSKGTVTEGQVNAVQEEDQIPDEACSGGGARPHRERRRLVPGARLMREWGGRTHVVDVIEGGFVFEAKVYPSLTAIAGKITGAHWSGPRFFGL